MAFQHRGDKTLFLWQGNPDCQTGHDWLLEWLKNLPAPFLNSEHEYSVRIQGNLGEGIAFHIGYSFHYPGTIVFPANALTPLSNISRSDIDIIYLRFGQTPDDDLAIVQEVKATTQSTLGYAYELIPDYDKLFGTKASLTLQSKLDDIKNKLELQGRPELCARVALLGANSPKTATKVRLVPTLIHDLNAEDPTAKMLGVRRNLIGKGWSPDTVTAWAIGLAELDDRLIRLALGQK